MSDRREGRLQSAARIFESIQKILVSLIWIAVIAIVLATVGKYLLSRHAPERVEDEAPAPVAVIPEPIPWHEVDGAVVEAVRAAYGVADSLAGVRIDAWTDGLMVRVDSSFLDWYFSYWNQQVMGLQSLWYASVHTVLEEQPTAAEKITESIQEEFARRVLRPQLAQLELENITREVVDLYVLELARQLDRIPEQYDIPHGEWDRYLDDIAALAANAEAGREVPLTLKTLTVAGAGSAVVLGKQIQLLTSKLGSKVAAKSAGKAAAQMATKTGSKVAAKAGGKLLGPIIGVGIIIWDVWDHHQTQRENRPILRQTMVDYMAEMKESLLYDADTGMMAAIGRLEGNVVRSLRDRRGE
jgi:hypothetical protein